MVNISTAVIMVAQYIVTGGLYNFKSLTKETQQKLINAYGTSFEDKVNAHIAL